ncbi:hypothetical protein D3C71_1667840 [compost metagenome]
MTAPSAAQIGAYKSIRLGFRGVPVRKVAFVQKCRMGLIAQMLRRWANCGLKRCSIAGILRSGLILIKRIGETYCEKQGLCSYGSACLSAFCFERLR